MLKSGNYRVVLVSPRGVTRNEMKTICLDPIFDQASIDQVVQDVTGIIAIQPTVVAQLLDGNTTQVSRHNQRDLSLMWEVGCDVFNPGRNLRIENSKPIEDHGKLSDPGAEFRLRQAVFAHPRAHSLDPTPLVFRHTLRSILR